MLGVFTGPNQTAVTHDATLGRLQWSSPREEETKQNVTGLKKHKHK